MFAGDGDAVGRWFCRRGGLGGGGVGRLKVGGAGPCVDKIRRKRHGCLPGAFRHGIAM